MPSGRAVADLVGGHRGDRLGLENADPFELAPVEEHLGEPRVISGRREQAAAAGEERLRAVFARQRRSARCRRPGRSWPPGPAWTRAQEERVVHVERREDPLLQIGVETLTGDDLDQTPQHVVAQPVGPPFAGLVRERGLAEVLDLLGDRLEPSALHAGLRIASPEAVVVARNPP